MSEVSAERPPETAETADRDPKTGRLLPGNQLAKGARGNSGWLRQVRDSFRGVVTPEAMAEVWRGILADAIAGDAHARTLCVRYSGAPPEPEEEKGEDLAEILGAEYRSWLEDVNTAALVQAGCLLEEQAKKHDERVRALEAELAALRTPAAPLALPPHVEPADVREVEVERPRPARELERVEPEPEPPEPEPEAKPKRRRMTVEEFLNDPGWKPC